MLTSQYQSHPSSVTFNHAHMMLCFDCDPIPASQINKFRNHLLCALVRYLHDEDFDVILKGKHSVSLISVQVVTYESMDDLMEELRIELALAISEWNQAMPG